MAAYLLHGVADRDPNELVAQFFQYPGDVVEFVRNLPGNYRLMHLQSGVNMDLLRVTYDLPI
jgi:hypothetical protein